MPRYLVEREFPAGVPVGTGAAGAQVCVGIIENNAVDEATWLHSYVSADRKRTYCVYEAPTPEAIRRAANRNQLPVGRITEVRVLDPHSYT